MPFIDFAILLLLIWAVYSGWRHGLLKELVSAVGFVVGLFIAASLYSAFGEHLAPRIGASVTVASIVAFLVLWIVVPIVLGMLANILTKALKGMHVGLPNSLLGAAVSVVKYLVLMSCVFNVLSFLGMVSPQKAEESFFYEPVRSSLGRAFAAWRADHADDSAQPADSAAIGADSVSNDLK